jgi:hypothetical protein
VQKSSVVPIRCSEIDIESVLQGFLVLRSTFPIRYLGLPLSVHHLRSGDFQFIVDKMASKLPIGQGKFINRRESDLREVRHCLPSYLRSYHFVGPKRHLKGNVQARACISLGGVTSRHLGPGERGRTFKNLFCLGSLDEV